MAKVDVLTDSEIDSALSSSPVGRAFLHVLTHRGLNGSELGVNAALNLLEVAISEISFGGRWEDFTGAAGVGLTEAVGQWDGIRWWFDYHDDGILLPFLASEARDRPDVYGFSGPSTWWSEPIFWRTPAGEEVGQVSALTPNRDAVFRFCRDEHHYESKPNVSSDTISLERIKIFTVTSRHDWVRLVRMFPRIVDYSARGAGLPVFRQGGRELQPDWQRVKDAYDGVRISVGGFVDAAYNRLTVDREFSTVLAGWNPGETLVFDRNKIA